LVLTALSAQFARFALASVIALPIGKLVAPGEDSETNDEAG
jgi:hypothetical protein